MIKIGLFGSCQLHLCSNFFLNNEVIKKNNFKILFSLPFYEYNPMYEYFKEILNYKIFDDLDILIIENNNLNNEASSKKIINYCLTKKNLKIIKTFLIYFPIFPLNWDGYGENKNDYLNWIDLDKINYQEKFEKCITSCREKNINSDLSLEISNFIENNFNKKLLFTHSLHPTNVLLYELWKNIFVNLSININDYSFVFNKELLLLWNNPFTTKMIKDLDIQFETNIDDNFYIDRYNENK